MNTLELNALADYIPMYNDKINKTTALALIHDAMHQETCINAIACHLLHYTKLNTLQHMRPVCTFIKNIIQ